MFKEKYEEFRKNNPNPRKLEQGIFFKKYLDMGVERKEITQALIDVDHSSQESAKSRISECLKKVKERTQQTGINPASDNSLSIPSDSTLTATSNDETVIESNTTAPSTTAMVIPQSPNLPDNMPDLSKYVLIGRNKLNAVKAEIAAIQKLNVAKELCDQKRTEAQDLAEIITYAEMKLGDLFSKIPKASGGNHGNQYTNGKNSSQDNFANSEDFSMNPDNRRPKAEIIAELGFSTRECSH